MGVGMDGRVFPRTLIRPVSADVHQHFLLPSLSVLSTQTAFALLGSCKAPRAPLRQVEAASLHSKRHHLSRCLRVVVIHAAAKYIYL